jgi:putative nucleotidyltransferase with HDIG domain
MRKLFIFITNRHEDIFKYFIVILAIFLISRFFTDRIRYKYEFSIGAPWKYNDLYAPFDFAVIKPNDSLEAEKRLLMRHAPRYYRVDTTIAAAVIRRFETEFETEWNRLFKQETTDLTSNKELVKNEGIRHIQTIYTRGYAASALSEEEVPEREFYLVKGHEMMAIDPFLVFDEIKVQEFLQNEIEKNAISQMQMLEPLMMAVLKPNVEWDAELTQKELQQRLSNLSVTRGMVMKGELIISKDEPVTPEVALKLKSLRRLYEQMTGPLPTDLMLTAGRILMITLCILMLLIFLATLRKDIYADNVKVLLILSMIVLISFAFSRALKFPFLNEFLVPVCILPIVLRVFFDTRLALFTHIITVLFLGMHASNGFDFVFIQIIAGMVTIFSFTHLRRRAQLFYSVILIFLSYIVSYLALTIIHHGNLKEFNFQMAGWFSGNVMLTLFAYPLIYIIEKVFKLTSDVSLLEMADLNSPLLRDLSVKAPGTFQHSMQVANLAESAIYEIGGNALLVRVGALYHDIGKMDMPLYFIENQTPHFNPHDELPFEQSAAIIISHVIKGVEKARQHHLPDLVIDFIRTHHGTTRVQYFYQSFLKNFPEERVVEETFRYPGPLPFSKETAVLMMADSVEAASRSLKSHDAQSLANLIDDILNRLISQEQFINCNITFRDITIIKKVFRKMLMSMYHVRVEYLQSVA